MNTQTLLALVIGYLLGSIPFGLLLTRAAGKGDIRQVGSGNIGATNVLRAGGRWLAAATLILDALKGAVAVLVARLLWPGLQSIDVEVIAAAGALLGHLYPVWLRFRGGKGAATFLGILIPLLWPAAVVYAIVWVTALALVRISSVGGMLAAVSAPVTAAVLGSSLLPVLAVFALLVLWRHRTNISRLMAGTEPRIGRKA